MRHQLGDPGATTYYHPEAWLNEVTLLLLLSSTRKAVAAAVLDSDGNQVSFGDTATPTALVDGRRTVTTAGTAVQLSGTSTAIKRVTIAAETDNTNYIVVGASTVVAALATRRGIPLGPGDTITLRVDNLTDVWLNSLVDGEGVTFTAET